MSKPASEKVFQKTDYEIPIFSMKSALIILLDAIVGTFVFPYILTLFGVSFKFGVILGNVIFTGYALSYARFFIESNKGYCKKFWFTYAGFSLAFAIIVYFWLYLGIYI
ncbi:hypothetical protein [Anaerosalibacter massiliensis]|uniref:Uncharacterized protein n=1 Tax=Anaerosalibacter massiliensis TaxID=1347392 RepID=A0A9X2MJ78_9FIRM|nr:hypothetical protein [Anaerosalibacter massiliensis]MCR2044501.1 hypothetical protein [Anaerosalibacter massiliensis]